MAQCKNCGASHEVIWFDRSDNRGDAIAAWSPTKGNITYAQMFAEPKFQFHRNDIALINLPNQRQLVLYPGVKGPHGDAWPLLTKDERKEARRINARMLQAARQDNAFARAMNLYT